MWNYLCKHKTGACVSDRMRVSEIAPRNVPITAAMGVDARATMSVGMCARILTVDENGLVKPMFVQSVFPYDCLEV